MGGRFCKWREKKKSHEIVMQFDSPCFYLPTLLHFLFCFVERLFSMKDVYMPNTLSNWTLHTLYDTVVVQSVCIFFSYSYIRINSSFFLQRLFTFIDNKFYSSVVWWSTCELSHIETNMNAIFILIVNAMTAVTTQWKKKQADSNNDFCAKRIIVFDILDRYL